jgi:hypothetical protein
MVKGTKSDKRASVSHVKVPKLPSAEDFVDLFVSDTRSTQAGMRKWNRRGFMPSSHGYAFEFDGPTHFDSYYLKRPNRHMRQIGALGPKKFKLAVLTQNCLLSGRKPLLGKR